MPISLCMCTSQVLHLIGVQCNVTQRSCLVCLFMGMGLDLAVYVSDILERDRKCGIMQLCQGAIGPLSFQLRRTQ